MRKNSDQIAPALNLVEALIWHEKSELPSNWRAHYENMLLANIDKSLKSQDDSCIVEALRLLPPNKLHSFLRSPQIAAHILNYKHTGFLDSSFISLALLKEFKIEQFKNESNESLGINDKAFLTNSQNLIKRHIHIDFNCRLNSFDYYNDDLLTLEKKEQINTTKKIIKAVSAMEQMSISAYELWADSIDVIVVRKQPSNQNRFISNTSANEPRSIFLINAHLALADTKLVSEALLHEAIHSLLFTYESITTPFLINSDQSKDTLVCSPWTNKQLRLISYVHACIVWYGLFWFWRSSQAVKLLPTTRLNREIEFISSGFNKRPISNILKPHLNSLSIEIKNLLIAIEEKMTQA
jgi:hypothetical protein